MKYFLILICMLLLGVMYYQYQYYPQLDFEGNANHEELTPGDEPSDELSRLKPISAYADIIKRPLFSLDRKPPQIESKSVVATFNTQELDDLILFGVVVSKDTTYAIVGNSKDGETEQLKEGRLYRGWRVEKISSESVRFEGKDAQYELFLTPNENTKKSGFINKKPTPKVIEYKSLFRSSQKRSPISITPKKTPPATKKKTQVREPISEADLERLYEEGGFEYEPGDEEELGEDAYLDDYGDEYYEE